MPTYTLAKALSGVRGTFYSTGSSYIYFVNDDGKIYRVRITPSEVVVKDSKVITKSTASHNLDGGSDAIDVRWNTSGAFERRATSVFIAQITPPPTGGLNEITPEQLGLMTINGTSFAEAGNSVTGNFYAVKTTQGNFAAVRIYRDTTLNATMMEWVTFRTSTDPDPVGIGFGSPQDLIMIEDSSTITAYVSGTNAYGEGCVFVAYSAKNKKPDFGWNQQLTIAKGLNTPKQMLVEPNSGMLLVADGVSLNVVDPSVDDDFYAPLIDAGPQGLNGVAVTSDGKTVYVSSEADGAIYKGQLDLTLNKVTLDISHPVATGLGPVGYLRWADVEETALIVAVGDDGTPKGKKLLRIPFNDPTNTQDLLDGITNAGVPRSVEMITSTRFFLASSVGVGEVECGLPLGLDVALGLGFVPFQAIQQTADKLGLANTMDPVLYKGYFFKVNDVPFGGTLHLLLNHSKAWTDGSRYFQVRFIQNGVAKQITDEFSDLKWNSSLLRFVSEAVKPVNVGTKTAAYPIRSPSDLWYNANLGALLNSGLVPNGVHTLEITFLDASGAVKGSFTKSIRIENLSCRVKFISFLVNGQSLNTKCGVWQYSSKEDPATFQFQADYAGNIPAKYSLSVSAGSVVVRQSGNYDPASPVFTQSFAKLRDLMGKCNIATISARLDLSFQVTNGYTMYGGGNTGVAFALVPQSFVIDEP